MTRGEHKKDADIYPIVTRPKFKAIYIHKYWIVLLVVLIALSLPLIVASGAVEVPSEIVLVAIGACFLFFLLSVFHTKLYQMVTIYEININAVVKRYGIIRKRTLNVPMEMVTDTSIERDIPDHVMGTATLLVNTAGTNEYAIQLKYISLSYARHLHDKIVELKRKARFNQYGQQGGSNQPEPKPAPRADDNIFEHPK